MGLRSNASTGMTSGRCAPSSPFRGRCTPATALVPAADRRRDEEAGAPSLSRARDRRVLPGAAGRGIVGRIAAMRTGSTTRSREKVGFFGFFEVLDDPRRVARCSEGRGMDAERG